MDDRTRERLHQLLDQMIDDGKELGCLDDMILLDGFYRINSYRLTLHNRQETIW